MSVPEQTQSSIELTNDSIIESIAKAAVTPSQSSTIRIPRLLMVRQKTDYEKYYAPKVVSIGPYHFGDKELEYTETLKPVFAMKLLKDNKETLNLLFEKLGEAETMHRLRSFYEEKQTTRFCDKLFTKMMLLDSCFILHYVSTVDDDDIPELNRKQLVLVYQDLLLLENQIPFEVLTEVMELPQMDYLKDSIERFVDAFNFVRPRSRNITWLQNLKVIRSIMCTRNGRSSDGDDHNDDEKPSHLLAAVHGKVTKIVKTPKRMDKKNKNKGWNFRNASELVNIGISFNAIQDTRSLTHIEFDKGWWGFSANVKLPPIILFDATRKLLRNMIAYETYCCSNIDDAWVTSYVVLLDSLIDDVEDVKVLRKAWVIANNLSSDKEVATLFNEIATEITPNSLAYLEAKNEIQKHYESLSNTLFSQLKNEYFKSPWAIFALLGALIALFLTGVQTYFTVWSPKSKCDDLCMFLKMNNHL